mmetsp:Transcript_104871/g.295409  ORF Transcript_104871/g.295409 Transcript_104871/m.295409 type:complete len:284 (+) Transcript_104871:119-970(+)
MSLIAEMLAGGVAGAAGVLSTQPLDTIRIRLQSSVSNLGMATGYNGIVHCAVATFRNEGLRGLYKGVVSPTATVGAMNAVLFLSYECASDAARKQSGIGRNKDLPLRQVFACGAVAGFTTAFITAPTELVKCLAQTDLRSKGCASDELRIMRRLVQEHGWLGRRGLARGLLTTIARETPSLGLYFSVYELICRRCGRARLVQFYAGGFAGAVAWASIYPVDVVKTRWQTAAPGTYRSVGHCLKVGFAAEGYGMFCKGFGATMARAWPQNAIVFFTYEHVKDLL